VASAMNNVAHMFLGLVCYYHHFIRDYGSIVAPLTKLLYKEGFHWTTEAEAMFHAVQQALTSAPILQPPAFDKDFVVECNTSGHGFIAVLHQGTGPLGEQVASWRCMSASSSV
jgi:hypothetical protein